MPELIEVKIAVMIPGDICLDVSDYNEATVLKLIGYNWFKTVAIFEHVYGPNPYTMNKKKQITFPIWKTMMYILNDAKYKFYWQIKDEDHAILKGIKPEHYLYIKGFKLKRWRPVQRVFFEY